MSWIEASVRVRIKKASEGPLNPRRRAHITLNRPSGNKGKVLVYSIYLHEARQAKIDPLDVEIADSFSNCSGNTKFHEMHYLLVEYLKDPDSDLHSQGG